MRHIKLVLIYACIVFFITGCFQSNQVINITPKGSGTIQETFLMNSEMIKQIQAMMSEMDQSKKGEKKKNVQLWKKKQFIDKALTMGKGVSFVSYKPMKTKDAEGFEVVYKFNDINTLQLNQNPGENIPSNSDQQTEKSKRENITFRFTKGNPCELVIISPPAKKEATNVTAETVTTSTEENNKAIEQIKALYKNLKISLKVNIIGKIINTDATHVQNSTITLMEMDFNKLLENPEKLKELSKQKSQSLQETKKLLADIPGIKVNLNNEIKVTFK